MGGGDFEPLDGGGSGGVSGDSELRKMGDDDVPTFFRGIGYLLIRDEKNFSFENPASTVPNNFLKRMRGLNFPNGTHCFEAYGPIQEV